MSTTSLPQPSAIPPVVPTHVYPPPALNNESAIADDSDDSDDEGSSNSIHQLRAIPPHLQPSASGSQPTRRLSTISRVTSTQSQNPVLALARTSSVSLSNADGTSIREDLITVPSLPPSLHTTNTIKSIGAVSDAPLNPTASHSSTIHGTTIVPNYTPEERQRFKLIGNIHFAALGFALFVEGWNDGSTGPLLPVFQSSYHIGFFIVSLYFVSNCAGFIAGSVSNVWLNDRIGFGRVMVLGAVVQLTAYIIQAPQPPFGVMVAANALTGYGMALQNAQANGFVGSLKEHMSTKLGIMHGLYGLGAFSSPFVATYFSAQKHWSFHYLVSTGLAVVNVAVLMFVFKGRDAETILAQQGQAPDELPPSTTTHGTPQTSKFHQILTLRAVHLLAFFALVYIGVEVTIGGWIVTYVMEERGGGHSAGYISSGFFGGLTLGRVGLMWLNKRLGQRRAIFFYTIVTIGLELTIWFVPSVIGNAVAVSLAGMALGPMFPILVSYATGLIPRWLFTVALGWITGIGMTGSAALPFLTGVLSQRFGIGALQPWLVSMMGCLLVVWSLVPVPVRRID